MAGAPQTDRLALRTALLANVARIGDALHNAVDGEETATKLSASSVDLLDDAGVLRMKLPAVLGGHEADLVTQFEVLEAIAIHSPAAAWCSMVGATSLGLAGAFLPDAGVQRMFHAGHIPRGAVLIMPSGKATAVEGGYTLNGRWAFASGIHHAEWVSALCLATHDGASEPVLKMMVFPTRDITIHDNWQVLGLRATGSCDISVADIFVPEMMSWNVATQTPQRGGPLFHLGIPAFVSYEHAAFATGVARSVLDNLNALAQRKKRGYGPGASSLADRASLQRLIGRADLQLRAARSLAIELNQQAMDTIESGEGIDARLALELRGSAVYCTEVASEIIHAAFRYAGAGAIFEPHVMQRCLRDINVAAQHLMVSDIAYELLGKIHLGHEDVEPMG